MRIHEIFNSIQGEGPCVGYKTTFIRFAGCNRDCEFCDTVFKDFHEAYPKDLLSVPTILNGPRHVCITGGEPTLQLKELRLLITMLKRASKTVSIESNGDFFLSNQRKWSVLRDTQFSYLIISPKGTKEERTRLVQKIATYGDPRIYLKHLATPNIPIEAALAYPKEQFVQPIWDDKDSLQQALNLVYMYPHAFRLSLQTHKYIGEK
jgi:organic radical activating enzyme